MQWVTGRLGRFGPIISSIGKWKIYDRGLGKKKKDMIEWTRFGKEEREGEGILSSKNCGDCTIGEDDVTSWKDNRAS